MLKIEIFFYTNINIKKKNNDIRFFFVKNLQNLKNILIKKLKKNLYSFSLLNSKKTNLITILKSPFHYKITKLNISEDFKKLKLDFYINSLNLKKKEVLFDKKDLISIFSLFSYFNVKKIKIKILTVFIC